MQSQELLQIDSKGRIVLPRHVRSKKKKYYACQTEEDGTVHLIPLVGVITSKQAYFWTRRWQQGEKDASQDIKKGKYKVIPPKKLKKYLQSI